MLGSFLLCKWLCKLAHRMCHTAFNMLIRLSRKLQFQWRDDLGDNKVGRAVFCEGRKSSGCFRSNFWFRIAKKSSIDRKDALVNIWFRQRWTNACCGLGYSEPQTPWCFILVGLFKRGYNLLRNLTHISNVLYYVNWWPHCMNLNRIILVVQQLSK